MDVRYRDGRLEKMESDKDFDGGYQLGIAKIFRKRIQYIRAAADERDFYSLRSLNYEKLKGDRSHQHSMRLNDQWRLIIELEGEAPSKTVVVVQIEDYH